MIFAKKIFFRTGSFFMIFHIKLLGIERCIYKLEMIVNLSFVFNCQSLAPLDLVYPRIGNLVSFVLFCHPLIETFERLCMSLPTLTLLHFHKIARYYVFILTKINPKIVIGIFLLSCLV